MKKTTMKALTAAAAALLIAAVFVGAGAAATEISVDKSGVENLWTNTTADYKHYWTYQGEDIVIPFNVTGTGNDKYLGGYTLTFAGNLTEVSSSLVDYDRANDWGADFSFVENGKTIAEAVTGTNLLKINQTNGNRTFQIGVDTLPAPGTETDDYGFYLNAYNVTLTDIADNLSTAQKEYADLNKYDEVVSSNPALQAASFWSSSNFVFKVRSNATDKRLNNTQFAFSDYNTTTYPSPVGTVYVYNEHEKGVAAIDKVDVAATLQVWFSKDYDTQKWESSDAALFTVPEQGTVSQDVISNVLTIVEGSLAGYATKNATLTLTLNEEMDAAKNVTTVTVNLSNWNPAYAVNNQTEASATYNNATAWSFVTPLKANYTIRAGPVNTSAAADGWNTSVMFANITVPGHELVGWTANITISDTNYELNGVTSEGLKNLTSNTYFKVTKNDVKDGTQTLNVEMKGYKLGDANIDDAVNIVDSAVVGITVLKSDDGVFLPAENRIYADCGEKNGDGDIDVNDILAINKFIVGLDPWGTAPA